MISQLFEKVAKLVWAWYKINKRWIFEQSVHMNDKGYSSHQLLLLVLEHELVEPRGCTPSKTFTFSPTIAAIIDCYYCYQNE
jgi:hypothetical protein